MGHDAGMARSISKAEDLHGERGTKCSSERESRPVGNTEMTGVALGMS
jgi:hypothetical protein